MNNSNQEEKSKVGVEARVHQIFLEYLNTFEKEGVAAVILPPKQKEGKEAAKEAGTPPGKETKGEEEKKKKEEGGEGAKAPSKEAGPEVPLNETEKILEEEKQTAATIKNDDDDDDEIKEGATITITMAGDEDVTKQPEQEQEAPLKPLKKTVLANEIIKFYATNAEKLNSVIKSTVKATNDLCSALHDFIIFVDTMQDSEVAKFKTVKGPEIANIVATIGASLLGPNRAQVGVSFVFMVFKLILQQMTDFLGADEGTTEACKKALEFHTEDFGAQSDFVALLGYTLSALSEVKEEENKEFYRDVRILLRDHFSREAVRDVEGIETSAICEELIYYGITFNFYDVQEFTIVTMVEEEPIEDGKESTKSTKSTVPMEEYFAKLIKPISALKEKIKPLEIVSVLKRLSRRMPMETAATLPQAIYTMILGLNYINPSHFFSTHELFKFTFVPEGEDLVLFDKSEGSENVLVAWILVLGTLVQKDGDFKNSLIEAMFKALTLPETPFEHTVRSLGSMKLDVLEGYEEDVKKVVDSTWAIVREAIKQNLSKINPKYLIAVPKAVFEDKDFQVEIEKIAFAEKNEYFDIFELELLNQDVMIQVIDRLLGNKSKYFILKLFHSFPLHIIPFHFTFINSILIVIYVYFFLNRTLHIIIGKTQHTQAYKEMVRGQKEVIP